MRLFVTVVGLAWLCGCGRTAHESNPPSENNAAGATLGENGGSPADVDPIDVSGQPTALPMTCEDGHEVLSFKLPCAVGASLTGQGGATQLNVVECELVGYPDHAAISFIVPLGRLPELLNEPRNIPFEDIPPTPPALGVALGDEHFVGTLSGVVTFTQVDVDRRTFLASLEQGHVVWNGDHGSGFACNTVNGAFWAIAGDFL
jgi:hypothetical protein